MMPSLFELLLVAGAIYLFFGGRSRDKVVRFVTRQLLSRTRGPTRTALGALLDDEDGDLMRRRSVKDDLGELIGELVDEGRQGGAGDDDGVEDAEEVELAEETEGRDEGPAEPRRR